MVFLSTMKHYPSPPSDGLSLLSASPRLKMPAYPAEWTFDGERNPLSANNEKDI